ncbi:hypothetical protein JAAARDRAFT_56813 [Jaapia argillacea MUCL 33604]|uniref:F-box domain-containing protein n=1 Tax=Jaapia argillacea MUCL 33604 TaxID=933084 RepID=A0A067Q181_9AGAM|nr:hypothetical protein JAAARDRAFT_56813 [Jaapia argillacea MUCL 33604]
MSGVNRQWNLPVVNAAHAGDDVQQPAEDLERSLAIDESANGHIPSDVLAEIFRYLQPPASYPYGAYAPREQPDLRDLKSAVLVCRAWRASGLEFLYRNPCIASARIIRSLTDTLMGNPGLATLIRSIIIPEFSPSRSDPFVHSGTLPPDNNLSSIMNACIHLHSVSISYSSSEPSARRQQSHIVFNLPNLTGIRRLCLSGYPSGTLRSLSFGPHSSLPRLEELYIGRVLDWLAPYPSLPSLHTLSLFNCEFHQGSPIPPNLTSIQHVVLARTSTHGDGQNQFDALNRLAHTLISLTISDWCTMNTPTIFDPSKFEKLQHLTLDLSAFLPNPWSTGQHPTLVFNQLPPELVTLTILVPINNILDADAKAVHLQESIRRTLRHTLQSGTAPIPFLKNIYIEGSISIWGSTKEKLTSWAKLRGIKATFYLEDLGSIRSHMDFTGIGRSRSSHLLSQDHGITSVLFGEAWQPTRSVVTSAEASSADHHT